jgi:hypothetical protein
MSRAALRALENVPLVAALFGVTDGLDVAAIPDSDISAVKDLIEINPAEVSLSADHDVYLIHRQLRGKLPVTWIGVYRQCFEMDNIRHGNFYGAGLWLHRGVAKPTGERIVTLLSELRRDVQRLAIRDGRLFKRLCMIRDHVTGAPVEERLAAICSALAKHPTLTAPSAIAESRGYVDAGNLHQDGITLQWLVDWALDDGPLFGQFSRVVIAGHPGAFDSGARSSPPLTPFELRKRQAKTVAGGKGATPDTSNKRTPWSYEAAAQQAESKTESHVGLEQRSHEMSIDYPRTDPAVHRYREEDVTRRALTYLQICAGLLGLILLAVVMMGISLG